MNLMVTEQACKMTVTDEAYWLEKYILRIDQEKKEKTLLTDYIYTIGKLRIDWDRPHKEYGYTNGILW